MRERGKEGVVPRVRFLYPGGLRSGQRYDGGQKPVMALVPRLALMGRDSVELARGKDVKGGGNLVCRVGVTWDGVRRHLILNGGGSVGATVACSARGRKARWAVAGLSLLGWEKRERG